MSEAQRPSLTGIAAGLAHDAMHGEAIRGNVCERAPRRLRARHERIRRARLGAASTESAFATLEIDFGEAAIAANEDALRTCALAFAAARAGIGKRGFGQRPWRSQRRRPCGTATKKIPAGRHGTHDV
jgi:hypothetical protein